MLFGKQNIDTKIKGYAELSSVSTQIEQHPSLERQGTVFGHTTVNFGENMSKNYTIYRIKCVENEHIAKLKIP